MKKIAPILTILIIVAIIIVLFVSMSSQQKMTTTVENNIEKKALQIIPGHFHDIQCAMTIESLHHACQAVSPSGKTWFFDDPGCMILWLEDKSFKEEAVLWVHTEDTEKWIDAKKAWYTLTDTTPMGYGFGAREIQKEGFIPFSKMRLKMLRGENLTDPKIRKQLLGN